MLLFSRAVDLALDWINHKLYVTDKDGMSIVEYDIASGERREVVNTGLFTKPLSIVVYPYPNYGYDSSSCHIYIYVCVYTLALTWFEKNEHI